MALRCSMCNSENMICHGYKMESDGAAYTWITWTHECRECHNVMIKEIQYPYNREEIECPYCPKD